MPCPFKPAVALSQRGVARLQEELPELRRERIGFVNDLPPEGCPAPAELLPLDVGAGDGLQVRESLTVVSGAREGAEGEDDVEEYLGGVFIVRTPRRGDFRLPLS